MEASLLQLPLEGEESARLFGSMLLGDKHSAVYSEEDWLFVLEHQTLADTPFFELRASLRRGIPECL